MKNSTLGRELRKEARILEAAAVLMDERTFNAKNYRRLATLMNEAAEKLEREPEEGK